MGLSLNRSVWQTHLKSHAPYLMAEKTGYLYCKWSTIGSRSRSGTYTHGSSYDLHTGSNRVPSSASWAPVHPVEEHVGISPFFVTSWLPVEKFGGLG